MVIAVLCDLYLTELNSHYQEMVQLGLGNSSVYEVIVAQAWRPAFGSSETTYNPGILVSA